MNRSRAFSTGGLLRPISNGHSAAPPVENSATRWPPPAHGQDRRKALATALAWLDALEAVRESNFSIKEVIRTPNAPFVYGVLQSYLLSTC